MLKQWVDENKAKFKKIIVKGKNNCQIKKIYQIMDMLYACNTNCQGRSNRNKMLFYSYSWSASLILIYCYRIQWNVVPSHSLTTNQSCFIFIYKTHTYIVRDLFQLLGSCFATFSFLSIESTYTFMLFNTSTTTIYYTVQRTLYIQWFFF